MGARGAQKGKSAMQSRKIGFTLIELLIVVAIIAILAAIAVPNFLSAQTRSRVSRVRADFRGVATALEAYQTDWQKYPVAYATGLALQAEQMNLSLRVLTTPIAYMTSVAGLVDPFSQAFRLRNLNNTRPIYMFMNYEPVMPNGLGPNNEPDWAYVALDTRPTLRKSRAFILWSAGPDQNDNNLYWAGLEPNTDQGTLNIYNNLVYDPTNGAISKGDMGRVGGAFRLSALHVDGASPR